MAKLITDYSSMFLDENNNFFSGLCYVPDFSLYSQLFKDYEIKAEQEFRPDKIAWELWNDQNAIWILNEINDLTNGISEYTQGRIIKYLDYNSLVSIGVI